METVIVCTVFGNLQKQAAITVKQYSKTKDFETQCWLLPS